MTTASSPWRETGDTDLSSFTKAVSRSWQAGSSPMAREAADVYAALAKHKLSRLGAAFAWHESKNASWNCATAPAGKPCIAPENRNPFAMKAPDGKWRSYASYAEAARDWAERLLSPTGPYARTGTIAELISVFAPEWDGNSQTAYRDTVCREVDALPLLGKEPAVARDNPFNPPVVVRDIDVDYAKYGLSKQQAMKVAGNRNWGRNGKKPSIVVLHVQEGTSSGSLRYWADTPGVQASSTVMVQKDGSLLRIIDEADAPWTNGDVQSPSPDGEWFLNQVGWANPNDWTLSIEAEGFWQDAHPEGQIETVCWLVWEWLKQYGLDPTDIYFHSDFNGVTRKNCPGTYGPVVVERVKAAWDGGAETDDDPLVATGIRLSMAKKLFPLFDPNGIRSQLWLGQYDKTGRLPRYVTLWVGDVQRDKWKECLEFADGLLIFSDGKGGAWTNG